MSYGNLECLVLTCSVDSKRPNCRPREAFLTGLSRMMNKSSLETIRMAKKKYIW